MQNRMTRHMTGIFLAIIGLTFLYPMIFMLNVSLKSTTETFNHPFSFPKVFVFANYPNMLNAFKFGTYFSNSLIYTVSTIVFTIIISCAFAYCVSRMRWKYGNWALIYITIGIMIPSQVTIVPLFILLKQLHLMNTYMGLIVPYTAFALSGCILMMYAFFRTLPSELEEAACIDGCNIYTSFHKVILPIVKPALATQVVLIFISIWNEFFLAFILAGRDSLKTLPIGTLGFFVGIGTSQWGLIGAAAVVTSIPSIIIYLIFSEQIEHALSAGALLK